MNTTSAWTPPKSSPLCSSSDQISREIHRLGFWTDTCREVNEMRSRTPAIMELYQKHGCRFLAPTHEQVQAVLNALDLAIRGWEELHPELFYQALELNFPELVRHR